MTTTLGPLADLALPALAWLYITAFWALYVITMGLYRAKLAGRLTRFQMVLGWPFVLAGLLIDVVSQYTLATLVFVDLPPIKEYMVTFRLRRYRDEQPDTWRGKIAAWICDQGLDSLDPTGDHC